LLIYLDTHSYYRRIMKMKRLISILTVLSVFTFYGYGAASGSEDRINKDLYKSVKGNLVSLSGKKLKAFNDQTLIKKKYIAFYYSAHWCGPCRQFTPKLVEFYNKNKTDDFEIIFVSSDRSAGDMLKYMEGSHMPWPAIKFNKIQKTKVGKYAGPGIPCLVLLDAKTGEVISESYENGKYKGPTRVMNALGKLLKEE